VSDLEQRPNRAASGIAVRTFAGLRPTSPVPLQSNAASRQRDSLPSTALVQPVSQSRVHAMLGRLAGIHVRSFARLTASAAGSVGAGCSGPQFAYITAAPIPTITFCGHLTFAFENDATVAP
jgi:hypothetical protein